MTQTEKARAYDEALERARLSRLQLLDIGEEATEIEYIFPELKESEDEEIRKALINVFATHKDYEMFFGVSVADILAWLEKQNSNIDNANKEYWRGYREGKQEILDKYAELKKQGEQKPADKDEPIVVRDFNSVFSREEVKEIDKRIEKLQKLYNAKLRDIMRKVEDFPMTD